MDCRGIFWELPTTRTSKPREPDSSVFCVVKSPVFLLEEDATLKQALTWDAVVAEGGGEGSSSDAPRSSRPPRSDLEWMGEFFKIQPVLIHMGLVVKTIESTLGFFLNQTMFG